MVAYGDGMLPDEIFRALADPARVAIVEELRERDGQALFELCGRLVMRRGSDITRQAVSKHLAVLADAGIVVARREGRTVRHSLTPGGLAPARDWLATAPAASPSRSAPPSEEHS